MKDEYDFSQASVGPVVREGRTKRLTLNVTPTEFKLANEAAREAGLSTSTFLMTMPICLREFFTRRRPAEPESSS